MTLTIIVYIYLIYINSRKKYRGGYEKLQKIVFFVIVHSLVLLLLPEHKKKMGEQKRMERLSCGEKILSTVENEIYIVLGL